MISSASKKRGWLSRYGTPSASVRARAAASGRSRSRTVPGSGDRASRPRGHAERVVSAEGAGRPSPTRRRRVRATIQLATNKGAERTERAGLTSISASHTTSSPPRFTRVDELEELAERVSLTAPAPYLLGEDSKVHTVSLSPAQTVTPAGAIVSDTAPARPCRQGAREHTALIVPPDPGEFLESRARVGGFPATYRGFPEWSPPGVPPLS